TPTPTPTHTHAHTHTHIHTHTLTKSTFTHTNTHTHTHTLIAFLYDKVAVSISPVKKMYLIVSYIDGPDAANPLMSLEPNRVVTYCVMEMARHCRYMVMIRHGYLLECQTCAIASSVSLHPVITWQLGRVCCHRNSSVLELKKTKCRDVSGLHHSHDMCPLSSFLPFFLSSFLSFFLSFSLSLYL